MIPDLEQALQQEAEVYITTYDAQGKPGTVPISFAHDAGKVYIATGRDSLKVRKLQADPRVRLAFGRPDGPATEGAGHICTDEVLVQHVAPILNRKYGGAWGPNAHMVRRLLGGDIVLLEITPL